jgi:hypothetical protein
MSGEAGSDKVRGAETVMSSAAQSSADAASVSMQPALVLTAVRWRSGRPGRIVRQFVLPCTWALKTPPMTIG